MFTPMKMKKIVLLLKKARKPKGKDRKKIIQKITTTITNATNVEEVEGSNHNNHNNSVKILFLIPTEGKKETK